MHETYVSDRNRSIMLLLMAAACCVAMVTAPRGVFASSLRRSAIVEAVSHARQSVVNIHGRKLLPAERDRLNHTVSPRQVNGMGTGIVIDQRGYVITNYHVVEGVNKIRVTMADESTVVATLVANDPKSDLAIIKIPAPKPLSVIRIGTSADLMPGETVVAVGNAYGYEHTVTQGIISALHRSVQVSDFQKYHDLIQTDASINPGNSGGPLLNIDGDMIGINVAVRVGAQGIGFAIPVDEAMEIAANLLSVERINHLYHGVSTKTSYDPSGSRLIVESVAKNSPAEKTGLKPGDIIVSAAGKAIKRRLDFERSLLGRAEGEEVPLEVLRNGNTTVVSLVLAETPRMRSTVVDKTWDTLGMRLTPIASSTFRKYQSRYRGGLKIAAVRDDGPAAVQGIRRGDILVGLHKWETISMDNVVYILSSAEFQATQPFKFYILRGSDTLYGHMRLAGK